LPYWLAFFFFYRQVRDLPMKRVIALLDNFSY